jgi:hypothetical protein
MRGPSIPKQRGRVCGRYGENLGPGACAFRSTEGPHRVGSGRNGLHAGTLRGQVGSIMPNPRMALLARDSRAWLSRPGQPFEFQTRKPDRFKRLKNRRILLANSLQDRRGGGQASRTGGQCPSATDRESCFWLRPKRQLWLRPKRQHRIHQQYPVVFWTLPSAATGMRVSHANLTNFAASPGKADTVRFGHPRSGYAGHLEARPAQPLSAAPDRDGEGDVS